MLLELLKFINNSDSHTAADSYRSFHRSSINTVYKKHALTAAAGGILQFTADRQSF